MKLPQGAICLSGDRYVENHGIERQLADCMVFMEDGSPVQAYVVELKGGGVSVHRARGQVQGGLDLVDELCPPTAMEVVPLIAHRGIDSFEIRYLDQSRVQFRGRSMRIDLVRCGSSLPAARRLRARTLRKRGG